MDGEVEKVRRAVAALVQGPGRRYPKGLKGEIAAVARRWRARGMSWQRIVDQLGIPTVKRLVEKSGGRSAFVRVKVVEPDLRASVTVVAPGGYRVEGLSVAETAELLRRLA